MELHDHPADAQPHSHVFLGVGHDTNERKTWAVIILCGAMMLVEIVGGSMFGSLALIADGLHMSTHAGAMLIAALAYTYARRHATDNRFVFGTGKLGDLAGFTSAVVLAMIALLIGYEAVVRFFDPVRIEFQQAIPIAIVGLLVNIVSAWLLSGDEPHGHTHGAHAAAAFDGHGQGHHDDQDFTDVREAAHGHRHGVMLLRGHHHEHTHEHEPTSATTRDNSMRSAYMHVLADAFVSVLAITGLVLAKAYGWLWMDPLAGVIGAVVIANWSLTLIRDTSGVLLDVCPDELTRDQVRQTIESDGDRVVDLHLWRLGPGHLAAVVEVATSKPRDALFYRSRLNSFACLSHITVQVTPARGS
jgi:cation diffusion facilitator family transporter